MKSSLKLSTDLLSQINDRVDELIDGIPEGRSRVLVSEFAETRILPEGTPRPGKWDNSLTPFFIEPMNWLSANHPMRELAVIKPAQIGATAALVENPIGYFIKHSPAPILYVTANDKLLKQWDNTRLIPLLKSVGLEDVFQAQQTLGKRKSRSGVTTYFKEFPGGVFGTGTGQSDASLRTHTYCYVFLDELTAYAFSANGKGDPGGLARARTTNYPLQRKIVMLSTPADYGTCQITHEFEQGDQRYWFVPCPLCGAKIVLEFSQEYSPYHEKMDFLNKEFGLVWEMRGRQIEPSSIRYKCVECGGMIKESSKYSMMQQGEWIATDTSISKYFYSISLSGLNSLLSPWYDIVKEWVSCGEDENKKKAFVTAKLGVAYRVTSVKPKFASILTLRGSFGEREIQHGTLFLTAAVDVQQGSKKNPDNPPRLEMEVVGHGLNGRTWSVEYKKFVGPIDDPNSGAWEQLFQYAQTRFNYQRSDGLMFTPMVILVDARSGVVTDVVCSFCNRLDFWFPSMSNNTDIKKSDEDETIDPQRYRDNIVPYRESRSGDNMIYLLSPNYFKRMVYKKLGVERQAGAQKYGFCEFPRTYEELYFKGLVSEDMTIDGAFVKRRNVRNEPLDIRAYNEAAARIFLDNMIKSRRKFLETKRKWTPELSRTVVNSKFVLKELEKQLQKKG